MLLLSQKMLHIWTIDTRIVIIVGTLLSLSDLMFSRGVSLSPCGSDAVQDVPADHQTRFTCTAEGPVQWRLHFEDKRMMEGEKRLTGITLATCNITTCVVMNTAGGLFTASVINNRMTTLVINPVNNTKLHHSVQLVNGTLSCTRDGDNMSSSCGLHYVYPPEGVSCTAENISWSVHVSCVIASIYSSRAMYTCQLLRHKHNSENHTLETVTMVISPTNERITRSEVKVSGSCQFITSLPQQEGRYGYTVLLSPGGPPLIVQDKWFAVERPRSPTVSCGPHPYVLENTNVTCTCNTTSLGQPAGYLRWITGNETNKESTVAEGQSVPSSQRLHYTQTLTRSDDGKTWFRCDILWKADTIRGQTYTASVGYAAETPRLLANGHEKNATVIEGHQLHLNCVSDGRPTPNKTIYNDNDNENSKVIFAFNATFTARCEDTAMYTCCAWNEFSDKLNTSLTLGVLCKPRNVSSTNGQKLKVKDKREMQFDVIAFPVPAESGMWFTESTVNSREPSYIPSSDTRVSCEADTKYRYLSRCTLAVLTNASSSKTGMYTVQLTNDQGAENFTFEIIFDEENNIPQQNHLFALWLAVGGVLLLSVFAVFVLINWKRMKVVGWFGTTGGSVVNIYLFMQVWISFMSSYRIGYAHKYFHLGVGLSAEFSRLRLMSSTDPSSYNSRSEEDHESPRLTAEIIYEIPCDSVPLTMRPQSRMTTPGTSQPKPCETPLYAVVDKKRKKTNTRPVHIADERGSRKRNMNNDTQGAQDSLRQEPNARLRFPHVQTRLLELSTVSGKKLPHSKGVVESEYLRDMEVVYAVVDKVKDKTKSSRGQGQTTDTPRGRQTMNDYYDKDQLTEEDPIYVNNSDIKFKKKKQLATAQTNIAGTKNLPSPSSSSQTVDNGRWENDDGLIYVTPFFDVSGQVRRPLHPRKEEADYCTLRLMQTKMSASDSDSDH